MNWTLATPYLIIIFAAPTTRPKKAREKTGCSFEITEKLYIFAEPTGQTKGHRAGEFGRLHRKRLLTPVPDNLKSDSFFIWSQERSNGERFPWICTPRLYSPLTVSRNYIFA